MSRCLPLLFLLVLLLQPLAAENSEKSTRDPKELIAQAEDKMNIFALPHFVMKATIQVDGQGKHAEGTYLLLWNGPEQWREQISFPDYGEIQVGGEGVVLLKRSTEVMIPASYSVHRALGFGTSWSSFAGLDPRPDEKVNKIHNRKINGAKTDCVEIEDREKHVREVCVDQTAGVIVRDHSLGNEEILPVGTKLFPRVLSFAEEGLPSARIQITELKTPEGIPPSAFEPPSGAVSRLGCMNPSPTSLQKRVLPRYPDAARQAHAQGTVAIYAVIGKDGGLSKLQIVSGVTSGLNAASLEAVRQWKYQPVTCEGIPVEIEVVIQVNYTLPFR